MATRRSIFIHPSGVGSKSTWTTYGAPPTHNAAVSKGVTPPTVPAITTGLRSTTAGNIDELTYPAISGVNPGEYVEAVRVWNYLAAALPAGSAIQTIPYSQSGVGVSVIPSAASGWQAGEWRTPLKAAAGNSFAVLKNGDTLSARITNVTGNATASDVAAQCIEVRLCTMEHLVRFQTAFLGSSSLKPFGPFTYAQYGSIVFDMWWQNATNRVIHLKEMKARGLDVVRIFVPFGQMMTSDQVVNEAEWVTFESFLDDCVTYDMRVIITGCETFAGPASSEAPAWYDALSEANRWANNKVWWNRCAKAVGGCAAVFALDLINEPIVDDGGPDYYFGSSIFYYAGVLSIALAGRTKAQVLQAWFDLMKTNAGINGWFDPGLWKMIFFSDHAQDPTGGGKAPDDAQAGGISTIACPHIYLSTARRTTDWTTLLKNTYKPLGKPIVFTETGLFTSPQGVSQHQHFLRDALDLGVAGVQGGWRSALNTYEQDGGIRQHALLMPVVKKRYVEGGRVAGRRRVTNRLGQRLI